MRQRLVILGDGTKMAISSCLRIMIPMTVNEDLKLFDNHISEYICRFGHPL